jgi:hypothetical protein
MFVHGMSIFYTGKKGIEMIDVNYDPASVSCEQAIQWSFANKASIEKVQRAGCYHCQAMFPVAEIKTWTDKMMTPQCPKCSVDAVLPLPDSARKEDCLSMLSFLSGLFDYDAGTVRTGSVTLTEDSEGNIVLPLSDSLCKILKVSVGDYIIFTILDRGRLEISAFTKPIAQASEDEKVRIAQVCPLEVQLGGNSK